MEIVESLKPDSSCAGESPVIRMWALRLMTVYRGHGKLGALTAYLDEDAETLLDACGLMSKAMQSSNPKTVSAELRKLRKAAEEEGRSTSIGKGSKPIRSRCLLAAAAKSGAVSASVPSKSNNTSAVIYRSPLRVAIR